MAVPKRRTSKMKKRMRRGANRWRAPKFATCSECGSAKMGHTACPSCGYYKEKQVMTVELDF